MGSGWSQLCTFAGAVLFARELHELAHELTARLLGHTPSKRQLGSCKTVVPSLSGQSRAQAIVRHAGWIASVALAILVHRWHSDVHAAIGFGLVALEAICSDLVRIGSRVSNGDTFWCGNFGLILLDSDHAGKVRQGLSTMVRVTCMRGAQSAGVVTYASSSAGKVGSRHRVVNGKRTDLTTLLLSKCGRALRPGAISAPQFFQGHTRFATSSIAALPGCHPHQWCKASAQVVWGILDGEWVGVKRNVESYITHNGDFDFLSLHGVIYPLEEVQVLLSSVLHAKMPASVDSACVAGMLDLLRTAGMWKASVRYGYLFGALSMIKGGGNLANIAQRGLLWKPSALSRATAIFEAAWEEVLKSMAGAPAGVLRQTMANKLREYGPRRAFLNTETGVPMPAELFGPDPNAAVDALVRSAVDAFFDQGLLAASRQLLSSSMGSFGLVLSHSLDADGELIIAARGQTMSVAFYPEHGMVMFGSESAATKAGMTLPQGRGGGGGGVTVPMTDEAALSGRGGVSSSVRLDMDDVNGEVVQLRWGAATAMAPLLYAVEGMTEIMSFRGKGGVKSTLLAWSHVEGRIARPKPLLKRMLQLSGNPLVQPLPPMGLGRDTVADDIADIPGVLRRIKEDWNEPCGSLNRMTAFTLSSVLRQRMRDREDKSHDGSLDVLISGCEVSLWLGEQFASDLHLAFPSLSIESVSANKLLGLLGQRFPIPQFGFKFNNRTYNLRNTIVILISHSGGTFATLNCSYLLKAFTKHLFVVTSEWDTQVARSVRAGVPGRPDTFRLASYIFTTFCGSRPAEPCSLTVAATHQLLTQILLHLMYAVRFYEHSRPEIGGATFDIEEVRELEALDQDSLTTLDALIMGDKTHVRHRMLQQGHRWAQHVLEGPICWIASATYILVTVVLGATPLSLLAGWLAPVVDVLFVSVAASSSTAANSPSSSSAAAAAVASSSSSPSVVSLDALTSSCVNSWGASNSTALAQCAASAALAHAAASAAAASAAAVPSRPTYSYVVAVIDAIIYMFLPWWTAVLLRLIQRRPWLHRVAGRSLLIGDIPWVAQSLEAFLSKMFALSYSIASISVASANPLDHLVHRHTHRVVRGSLLAVGRPDGRLNALTAAENTVCLSTNQASSIQNFGVTCESITVGHNPSPMALTTQNLFLPRHRPLFFSEYIVEKFGAADLPSSPRKEAPPKVSAGLMASFRRPKIAKHNSMSAGALMGKLAGLNLADADEDDNGINDVFDEVIEMEEKRQSAMRASAAARRALKKEEDDVPSDPTVYRQIPPLRGYFIGSWMAYDERYRGLTNQQLMDRQHFIQSMYETRVASLHRFVAFLVMFHALGKKVADFWRVVSFGLLAYDTSRTHSIMRIATTASPVSGMEVREKTLELAEETAKAFASRIFQMFIAKWYCLSGTNANRRDDPEKLESMLRILYSSGGTKYVDPTLLNSATTASFRKNRKNRPSREQSEDSGTDRSVSAAESTVTPGSSVSGDLMRPMGGLSVLGAADISSSNKLSA